MNGCDGIQNFVVNLRLLNDHLLVDIVVMTVQGDDVKRICLLV